MHRLRSTTAQVADHAGNRRRVRTFVGVRYAELANGRRFDAAVPVCSGDHAAEQAGFTDTAQVPIFPQLPFRLAPFLGQNPGEHPQREDAFFLNISVPADAAGAPVLVFVHGGAWVSGAGSYSWYRGAQLAAEGICVVTVNYRLHAAGLLTEDSPHLPLSDLKLAVRWVQQNIAAFDGDPANVTVAGQSAGGWYVHALAQDPQLRGAFRRIALWSMATRTPWPAELMGAILEEVRRRLRSDDLAKPRARLLMTTALSVAAQRRDEFFAPAHLGYAPPALLPAVARNLPADFLDPRASAERLVVDRVLLRYTTDETGIFFANADREVNASHQQADLLLESWLPDQDRPLIPQHLWERMSQRRHAPYQRIRAVSSWMQFQRLAHRLAEAYRTAGKATQLHEFTFASPLPGLGSSHCFDLPFQFGNRQPWSTAPMLNGVPESAFQRVAADSVAQLLTFMTS